MAESAVKTAADIIVSILLRIGEVIAFVVAVVDLFGGRDHIVLDAVIVFCVAVLVRNEAW